LSCSDIDGSASGVLSTLALPDRGNTVDRLAKVDFCMYRLQLCFHDSYSLWQFITDDPRRLLDGESVSRLSPKMRIGGSIVLPEHLQGLWDQEMSS